MSYSTEFVRSTRYLHLVCVLRFAIVAHLVVSPMRRRIQLCIGFVQWTWCLHNRQPREIRTQDVRQASLASGSAPPTLCCIVSHVFMLGASPIRPLVVTIDSHDDSKGKRQERSTAFNENTQTTQGKDAICGWRLLSSVHSTYGCQFVSLLRRLKT